MAKRNLSALLDTSITAAPSDEDSTSSPTTAVDQASLGEEAEASASDVASLAVTDTPPAILPAGPATATRTVQPPKRTSAGPRYLQLDRKELRIRGDQADALTALTRQLNRARKGAGERITDNTLIRVAIDLLLRDRAKLHGATEADLLRSALPD